MKRFVCNVVKSPLITRGFSSGGPGRSGAKRFGTAGLLIGGASVAAAGGAVYYFREQKINGRSLALAVSESLPEAASASAPPKPQESVISGTKEHALYLWINLKPEANVRQCAKVLSQIQKYVDEVCPPDLRDEDDEVLAGVGFGPNFYRQVGGKTAKHNFVYAHRRGTLGEMPSSGGDIFVHAKCHKQSKLFELVQVLLRELPKESIANFEDIYGWVYKNGRDLSGFIDGTENPADEDDRTNVAVDKDTGGAYVITQKWLHRHNVINTEKERTMENWLGRSRPDSIEQSRKSISSHVARMTGGNSFEQSKRFQIVRQSQPFGTMSGDSGLFFIAYASSPTNFDWMLDRMVGAGGDGHSDDVMRLSTNVKGTYWYFPSSTELKQFG